MPSVEDDARILTTREAARVLGLSAATLETWRCKGMGPKFVRIGLRKIGYWRRDLITFVEGPGGHPNSRSCGRVKLPHPEHP